MQIFIYGLFGAVVVFHLMRIMTAWRKNFPDAPAGTDYEEVIQKTVSDPEFRSYAIGTTSWLSQFLSALSIFTLFFLFKWGDIWVKALSIAFAGMEVVNIIVSEHVVTMSLRYPGKLKPLWLIIYGRLRSLLALGTGLLAAAGKLL